MFLKLDDEMGAALGMGEVRVTIRVGKHKCT